MKLRHFYRRIIQKLNLENDEAYAKRRYFDTFHKELDFSNPQTLNEKIQWFKLNRKREIITKLSDKLEVRDYVAKHFDRNILNEIYGIYDSPDEIDFNKLPNQFVIKTNHGSGWNIICRDKTKLNIDDTRRKLKLWLSQDYSTKGREWNYHDIKARILIEKFLGFNTRDYKFFCFDGKPKYIQVDFERFTNHKRSIYDINWEKQKFGIYYPLSNKKVKKPANLKKMIKVAEKLSADFRFVRVDLYSVRNRVVFGEMTFYPGNGFETFMPSKYDLKLGKLLPINQTR